MCTTTDVTSASDSETLASICSISFRHVVVSAPTDAKHAGVAVRSSAARIPDKKTLAPVSTM
jgi:hypothetical protein